MRCRCARRSTLRRRSPTRCASRSYSGWRPLWAGDAGAARRPVRRRRTLIAQLAPLAERTTASELRRIAARAGVRRCGGRRAASTSWSRRSCRASQQYPPDRSCTARRWPTSTATPADSSEAREPSSSALPPTTSQTLPQRHQLDRVAHARWPTICACLDDHRAPRCSTTMLAALRRQCSRRWDRRRVHGSASPPSASSPRRWSAGTTRSVTSRTRSRSTSAPRARRGSRITQLELRARCCTSAATPATRRGRSDLLGAGARDVRASSA